MSFITVDLTKNKMLEAFIINTTHDSNRFFYIQTEEYKELKIIFLDQTSEMIKQRVE